MSSIHSASSLRFQGRQKSVQQSGNFWTAVRAAGLGLLALNPAAAALAKPTQDDFSRSQLSTQVGSNPGLSSVPADLFSKAKTLEQQVAVDQLIGLIHEEELQSPPPGDRWYTRLLKPFRSLKQVDAALSPADQAVVDTINSLTEKQAKKVLKESPFVPNDVSILSPNSYPDAPPYIPAPITNLTYSDIYTALKNGFLERFNGDEAKAKATADLLDDPQLTSLAPKLILRAALVYLNGTILEPALASYRKGDFDSVDFDLSVPSNLNAQSVTPLGSLKPIVQVNSDLKGEKFWHFASLLGHENLHRDPIVSAAEELINAFLEILTYALIAEENENITKETTILPRSNNISLLGLLNSRDSQGSIDINNSLNRTLLPQSIKTETNFANYILDRYSAMVDSSPGNPTLDAILTNILGKPIRGAQFDQNTLDLLKQQIVLPHTKILKLLGPEALNTSIPLDGIQKKAPPPQPVSRKAPPPRSKTALTPPPRKKRPLRKALPPPSNKKPLSHHTPPPVKPRHRGLQETISNEAVPS